MTHHFRVLLLDDDLEVLRRAPERIRQRKREYEGRTWEIDLRKVHVRLESGDGRSRFAPAVLDEIAAACSEPPHLICADYGYADPAIIRELREKAQTQEITQEE